MKQRFEKIKLSVKNNGKYVLIPAGIQLVVWLMILGVCRYLRYFSSLDLIYSEHQSQNYILFLPMVVMILFATLHYFTMLSKLRDTDTHVDLWVLCTHMTLNSVLAYVISKVVGEWDFMYIYGEDMNGVSSTVLVTVFAILNLSFVSICAFFTELFTRKKEQVPLWYRGFVLIVMYPVCLITCVFFLIFFWLDVVFKKRSENAYGATIFLSIVDFILLYLASR